MGRGDMMYQRLAYAPKAHRARPKTKKSPPLLTGIYIIQTPLSFGEVRYPCFGKHRQLILE